MRTILILTLSCCFFSCKKNTDKNSDLRLTANEFLINAGGSGTDLLNDMVVDNDENIYLTGWTNHYINDSQSIHFGNRVLKLNGDEEAVVAKYDRYGNVIWAKVLGSNEKEEGIVLTVDNSNNCYVAGTFGGTVNFGNTSLTPVLYNINNGSPNIDMFLAKYDPQGKEVWSKRITGVGYERPSSMLIDKSGNLFVAGYFYKDIKFENTTVTAPAAACFLAKYATDGSLLWVRRYGDNPYGRMIYATSMKLDKDNNIIVSGSFEGPQQIGSYNAVSNGAQDVYVAKLDPTGNTQWVTTFGGTLDENCNGLAIDQANNIYIGGAFAGSISTGGLTVNSTNASTDAFFAKLTTDGSVVWLKCTVGSGTEIIQDMVIKNDTLYSAGFYNQDFQVENRTGVNNGGSGFIMKHDLSGKLAGLATINLNLGNLNKLYLNSEGYTVLAGYFNQSMLLNNMSVASFGARDLFVLKAKLTYK